VPLLTALGIKVSQGETSIKEESDKEEGNSTDEENENK